MAQELIRRLSKILSHLAREVKRTWGPRNCWCEWLLMVFLFTVFGQEDCCFQSDWKYFVETLTSHIASEKTVKSKQIQNFSETPTIHLLMHKLHFWCTEELAQEGGRAKHSPSKRPCFELKCSKIARARFVKNIIDWFGLLWWWCPERVWIGCRLRWQLCHAPLKTEVSNYTPIPQLLLNYKLLIIILSITYWSHTTEHEASCYVTHL